MKLIYISYIHGCSTKRKSQTQRRIERFNDIHRVCLSVSVSQCQVNCARAKSPQNGGFPYHRRPTKPKTNSIFFPCLPDSSLAMAYPHPVSPNHQSGVHIPKAKYSVLETAIRRCNRKKSILTTR